MRRSGATSSRSRLRRTSRRWSTPATRSCGAFAGWTLDPARRAEIYAAALAIADAAGFGGRVRALGLDRRVQAIAGGTVVTLAAAAAVAIARGRRQTAAPLRA